MFSKRILMVRPNGFRVDYAINPYMLDARGNLQKVDSVLALKQWESLKDTFTSLGERVDVLEGDPEFPDMVFCANQTLPVLDKNGRMQIVLSRMHSAQRQGETQHLRKWAEALGLTVHTITGADFEGAGDAIWNYETHELFGGYGFRSTLEGYRQLEAMTGIKAFPLELVSENFYHMDTCFAILNAQTVAYVPGAFSQAGRKLIQSKFKTQIIVDETEAAQCFAANCVSVDGLNVVLQKGARKFEAQLIEHGFKPVPVDVSEFLKSGGAVFCMKQIIF